MHGDRHVENGSKSRFEQMRRRTEYRVPSRVHLGRVGPWPLREAACGRANGDWISRHLQPRGTPCRIRGIFPSCPFRLVSCNPVPRFNPRYSSFQGIDNKRIEFRPQPHQAQPLRRPCRPHPIASPLGSPDSMAQTEFISTVPTSLPFLLHTILSKKCKVSVHVQFSSWIFYNDTTSFPPFVFLPCLLDGLSRFPSKLISPI